MFPGPPAVRFRDVTRLACPRDEIQVWSARLTPNGDVTDEIARRLPPADHERAQRFRWATDRKRFVSRRALLRHVLGTYLDQEPWEVPITYGLYGKPTLQDSPLRFSATSSGDLVLIAIGNDRDVGVDVETYRIIEDLAGLTRVGLALPDVTAVTNADDPARRFLELWTENEAVMKVDGRGLPLRQARVPSSVWKLDLGRQFVGAVASEHVAVGRVARVLLREWTAAQGVDGRG